MAWSRFPGWLRALPVAAIVLAAGTPLAQAVTFIEQAQRLERINAALLDYRPGAPPEVRADSTHPLELVLELIPVPAIDNRVGDKKEPVKTPPVIPRARARYAWTFTEATDLVGFGAMVGATASPPVPVLGYAAGWLGGEAGLNGRIGMFHGELRAFTIVGRVTGPVTEVDGKDEFDFANSGSDLRVGLVWERWRVYGGAGSGRFETSLLVESDGAIIRDDGTYGYVFGGASYVRERWQFTFEQQSTEDYLKHVILGVSWRY